ncbi:hypothetical protein LTR85_011354 [Meristemomyces frigidus]|nr:hypothetical protein LTR85_011354 [Meristemomyces frigidus]
MWMILWSNYANILLFLIPIAYAGRFLHWPPELVLILNGLSMLPLSLLIALATEELSTKLGPTVSGVLNYSFGNAGTVIISCVLLKRGEILVVQTSLLGAIVFNLLAVMGCQYLASGIRRSKALFNETIASVNGSVLLLPAANIALPAILRQVQGERSVVLVSRQLAITSIVTYLALLFFQFRSHAKLYDSYSMDGEGEEEEEEEVKEPELLLPPAAFVLLATATAALAAASEFFVDTLDDVTAHHGISRTFIGFIFLPLVSNAVSHLTEIGDAWRNKLDKASVMAIGCSIQIAMFIIPLTILVGWAIQQDMTLNFDVFLNASAFIAVLLLNSVTQHGKSNFMEGMLLLNCYLGIAASASCYPAGAGDGQGK